MVTQTDLVNTADQLGNRGDKPLNLESLPTQGPAAEDDEEPSQASKMNDSARPKCLDTIGDISGENLTEGKEQTSKKKQPEL